MEVYQFNKWRMYKRNDGTINELTFHGTKENDPMVIWKGEDGFDLWLRKEAGVMHCTSQRTLCTLTNLLI